MWGLRGRPSASSAFVLTAAAIGLPAVDSAAETPNGFNLRLGDALTAQIIGDTTVG